MATNLVTLVTQYLTPDLVGRIAAAQGVNPNNTSTAISASVPALLAGICGVATQKGGGQRLLNSARQQTGTLDNFANMVGGKKASLIDNGSQMLTSLFGGQEQSALAGVVGKFSGLSTGNGSALLGMLAPVVMGTIAAQPAARNGDTGALVNLLTSQKDNISKAMPAGFSNLLGGSSLLEKFGGMAVGSAGQRAAGAATSGIPKWILWALAAVVAAFVIWSLVGNRTEQVVKEGVNATQSLIVGGANIGTQLDDSLTGLRTALQGVTDAASAQAALPQLREAATQINKIGNLVGRLSPDQRKIAAGLVTPLMPALNRLFDKVLAIPEVPVLLKPTIDTLKASLATITE